MKLLNLNIGIKIDNNKEVIDLITKDNYDFVTLQEAMKKIDNTVFDRYKSSDIIRENTNYKYSYFGPLWYASKHSKNNIVTKDFGGVVEQGNEILSKYPIIEHKNKFYYREYTEFSDTTNFRKDDHPRAFSNCIIEVNHKKIQIINVHGIWNKGKLGDDRTMNQSRAILKSIRNDIPAIIIGDFNLLPNTESIKILDNKMINLINKYKIKSTRPNFDDGLENKGEYVCDYIFINDKVKVIDFKVINSNVSDHLPLILEFEI